VLDDLPVDPAAVLAQLHALDRGAVVHPLAEPYRSRRDDSLAAEYLTIA
jgi:hypothetical protein